MSVNPGFGGQKFIENTYQKIETLRNLIERKNAKTLIEIDGGVDLSNAKKLVQFGANILVAGNYIFKAENPLKAIDLIKF
jgi:ribulose-phosphate 3-epimerase